MRRRTRLDDLYEMREKIDTQILVEVKRLEDYARMMREEATRVVSGWAQCGTDGGYYRHRRTLKEPACTKCKVAHSEAEKERSDRHRMKERVNA